jgi:hypothetical protein
MEKWDTMITKLILIRKVVQYGPVSWGYGKENLAHPYREVAVYQSHCAGFDRRQLSASRSQAIEAQVSTVANCIGRVTLGTG